MTLWQYLRILFGQREWIRPVAVLDPGQPVPRGFPKNGLVYYRQT